MARVVGSFDKSANYEVSIRKPLDSRSLVPTFADLTTESNWLNDSGKSIVFNGMLVAVANTADVENSGVYYFFDTGYSTLKGGDVTKSDNWHKICELKELVALEARIEALEGATGGVDEEAVNALIKTQIDALREEVAAAGYLTADDIAGKADKEHTHTLADIADYTAPDLSNLATKDEVNAKADAEHTHNYATQSDIDTAVAGIQIPDVTNFVTMEDVEAKNYLTAVPEEFVKESELLEFNYAKQEDVNTAIEDVNNAIAGKADTEHDHEEYALKTAIPTKISQLEEDVFYVKEENLNDYATVTAMNAVAEDVADNTAAIASKAEAADLTALSSRVDNKADTAALNNYYDKAEVDQKITDAVTGGQVDLSGYAKTADLEATTAAVETAQGEIDALETNVATNYATNKSVDDKIAAFQITYGSF